MYELAEMPDSAFGEERISLRRKIESREAEFAAKLAVFERHKGYLAYGCLSLLAWLRWQSRMRLSSGKTRLEMARQLEQLPDTAKALAEGAITFDNARVITRKASAVGAEKMGAGRRERGRGSRALCARPRPEGNARSHQPIRTPAKPGSKLSQGRQRPRILPARTDAYRLVYPFART